MSKNIRPEQNFTGKGSPLKTGQWVDPLLGEWTEWQMSARHSEHTIRLRAPVVQYFAEDLGVSPVVASTADVRKWFSAHPEWSQATAVAYWTALKCWFNWLVLQEYRADNPMLRLKAPVKPAYEPRPVSDEDLRRLLSSRIRQRTRVMILLGALAGLRASEIASVKGEDIDLSGRLMYVRGKGKGGGTIKTVPMHPLLVEAAARMPVKGFWFPSRKNPKAPLPGDVVSTTIARAMRRAGVRGTAHALRHWFGTNALRASGDLRAVQVLMRHQSVQSTQIYTQVADDTRASVVEKLDPFGGVRRFLEEC